MTDQTAIPRAIVSPRRRSPTVCFSAEITLDHTKKSQKLAQLDMSNCVESPDQVPLRRRVKRRSSIHGAEKLAPKDFLVPSFQDIGQESILQVKDSTLSNKIKRRSKSSETLFSEPLKERLVCSIQPKQEQIIINFYRIQTL